MKGFKTVALATVAIVLIGACTPKQNQKIKALDKAVASAKEQLDKDWEGIRKLEVACKKYDASADSILKKGREMTHIDYELVLAYDTLSLLTQGQQEFVKNTQIMVDSVVLKQVQTDVVCAKLERKSSIYEGLLRATFAAAWLGLMAWLFRHQLKDAGEWIARQFRKKEQHA